MNQINDFFEKMENPFIIDFKDKLNCGIEDFVEVQTKLQQKDLNTFLDSLYPVENMRTSLAEMKRRVNRGLYAKLIDASLTIVPEIQMFQIGNGGTGKDCFVCCTPLSSDRYTYSLTIKDSLENVGFNGWFMLLNGGFPNPTGNELKFAGVPYSFKIFMMLEARKRGFEQVIWLDACCYAVNNPQRLFLLLKEDDAVFRAFPPNCFAPDTCVNIVFPKTVELLSKLVNRDIRNDINVNSIVFGLNFNSHKINEFIDEYYKMVNLGLPFLSGFPEEIVFTSIFNKPDFKYVFKNRPEMYKLYINETYLTKKDAKDHGYYFVQRSYN